MSDIYVDGQLATGAGDGTSWTDAYRGAAGLQAALDAAAAGDTIHVTRTVTLAAPLDVDTSSGSDGSPIRVVGYNYNGGAPVVDGTRVLIDAAGVAANCLAVANNVSHLWWENFEFANATGNGCHIASGRAYSWTFRRCDSRDHGADGWGGADIWQACLWDCCRAIGNGSDGWAAVGYSRLVGCTAIGNTSVGISASNYSVVVDCIVHDNGWRGVYAHNGAVLHSVIDGNASDGVYASSGPVLVAHCRITHNGDYGVYADSADICARHCYFAANASGQTGGSVVHTSDRGAEANILTGPEGYEDRDGGVLNVRCGAGAYAVAVDLGGGHVLRAAAGVPTMILPNPGGQR